MEESKQGGSLQLLEIERELSGPDAKAAMARYDGQLLELDGRLRRAMADGMTPDDYSAAAQLKDAVEVARKILRLTVR